MRAGDRQEEHGAENRGQRPCAARGIEGRANDEVGRGNRRDARHDEGTHEGRKILLDARQATASQSQAQAGRRLGHQRTETR